MISIIIGSGNLKGKLHEAQSYRLMSIIAFQHFILLI